MSANSHAQRFGRITHVLAFLAVALTAPAQTQPDRVRLAAQIAGPDQAGVADLLRIFAWGSRPWETTIPTPLVVEERDADRTFYFALEARDLGGCPPRLPRSTRETAFARMVDKVLKSTGPAPWPVFVFSAATDDKSALDTFSLATTRRIIVRDGKSAPQPASAILLNSACWGGNDAAPVWDGHLIEIAARHEIYHARRAWRRAEETAAHADAIVARLRQADIVAPDRVKLESLVRQGILAWEEVEAVDHSLKAAHLPTYRRQGYLEYRERNKQLQKKVVQLFAGFFTSVKDEQARRSLEQWLNDLLRQDLLSSSR